MLTIQNNKSSEMLIKEPKKVKNIPCRFDLFTRYKKDVPSKLPGGAREWCHRGDKFDKDSPDKMLSFLISIIKNHHQLYSHIVLRDNSKPANDKDRVVIKITKGELIKNIIKDYILMLDDIVIPEFLSYEVRD